MVDNLIGQTIGNYQIVSEIGRGGMAVVYKAYQPSLNRYVALKVLPPQFTFDTEFLRRFKQEAQNAARLKHPNIVIIHDVGEAGSYHYIVMEYLDGITLKALIERSGALPEPRALNILVQIASALGYAHAAGFVHRDVKPANVMIGANDLATLTDFGIAKAAEGAKLTKTGTLIGTPEYMSPEQARGDAVDYRTDIYSLGVVAYEMLSRRVPFGGTTPHAVLHKVIYEAPPALRSVNPRVSAQVAEAIMRAMAKEPRVRFASAGEMVRAAVAQLVQPQPIVIPHEARQTVIRPSGSAARRRSLLVPVGIVGLAIVAILSTLLIVAGNLQIARVTPTPSLVKLLTFQETLARLQPLAPGYAIPIRIYASRRSRVLDVSFYLTSNETEIRAHVSPDCGKLVAVVSKRLDSSNIPHWVELHVSQEVFVNGTFCIFLETSPGSVVSIGVNDSSQYLIRVAVSEE